MNEQPTPQQLNVAEIAAAFGTENLVVRLVQLQHQITELEKTIAALQAQKAPPVDMDHLVAKTPVRTNGR